MEEKKRKNGGWYLKEKIAKLERERDDLKAEIARCQQEKETLVQTAQNNYLRLEKERDELQNDLDLALEQKKAACDEYKAKYLKADAERQDAIDRYNRKQTDFADLSKAYNILSEESQNLHERIYWLLNHASWFTLWKYKRQFE